MTTTEKITRTATAPCAERAAISHGRRDEHYFGPAWDGVTSCTFCGMVI